MDDISLLIIEMLSMGFAVSFGLGALSCLICAGVRAFKILIS